MSTDCFKFQASVKFGEYDNAMLNVRADTPEEFDRGIQAAIDRAGNLALLSALVRSVAMDDSGVAATPVAAVSNPGAPPAPVPVAQPAPATPAAASPHVCAHGNRVKRAGGSGAEAWEGWFCPLPRERQDRCKPVYPGR